MKRMKKIVLGIVALIVCMVVFASQDVKKQSVSLCVPAVQTPSDAFRRIEMQELPHAVLRVMGTDSAYAGCTFEGAYMAGNKGQEVYKIKVMYPGCKEQFIQMDARGQVI